MARIVLITHAFDRLRAFSLRRLRCRRRYLVNDILSEMTRRGHEILIQRGVPRKMPTGDVGLLHVDATQVPDEYVELASHFPLCINGGVTDISKRRISGAVCQPNDDWDGPVIVKSNLNSGGNPEVRLNGTARRRLARVPFPHARAVHQYVVYPGIECVSAEQLHDPSLVVERFMPEPDPDGYGLRFWTFFGAQERCHRYVANAPILKGGNVVRSEPVAVPDSLRRIRQQLGFEYGKFDFVLHDGQAVLLDANKTPGRPPGMLGSYELEVARLANGFEKLIEHGRSSGPADGVVGP